MTTVNKSPFQDSIWANQYVLHPDYDAAKHKDYEPVYHEGKIIAWAEYPAITDKSDNSTHDCLMGKFE